MKRTNLITVLAGFAVVAILSQDAMARNRMYNPAVGRFMQRDPAGTMMVAPQPMGRNLSGSMYTRRDPAQQYADGMSLYQYVRSSPPKHLDPLGTSAVTKVVFNSEKEIKPWYFHITFEIKAQLDEPPVPVFLLGPLPALLDQYAIHYALAQEIEVRLSCYNTPEGPYGSAGPMPPTSSGRLVLKEVIGLMYSTWQSLKAPSGLWGYYRVDHHQHGIRRSRFGDNTTDCICHQHVNVRSFLILLRDDDVLPGYQHAFVISIQKEGLYSDKPDAEIDGHLPHAPAFDMAAREVEGSSLSWRYAATYMPNAIPKANVHLGVGMNIDSWPYD